MIPADPAIRSHGFPRILVIATWFGPLPAWFPLWMTSCRFNPDIDWLVATDASLPSVAPPPNVHVRHLSMAEFAAKLSETAGYRVTMERAYKACDFRPLYSGLTGLVEGHWDFWGHCDLDMIFGDIRVFLTPEILAGHDRVFGVGHFSLYRNHETANRFYLRPCPGLDPREILTDPQPRGFDEHIGVNRIWKLHRGRFHEDEAILADIDPHIGQIRRTSNYISVHNTRHQAFGFDRGRVARYWFSNGQLQSEDFMYVHFQKRKFSLPPPNKAERVWLTPRGLVEMNPAEGLAPETLTPEGIRWLNPVPLVPPKHEILHRTRRSLRLLRYRVMGGKA